MRRQGDAPLIFGRTSEEIEACRSAAIPVGVVPGIAAALGAATELAIPLTDRHSSRRLHFVTGHGKDGSVPDRDWPSLADPWTTDFYMGASAFSANLQRLLGAGLDLDTPAVAVTSATTPRSRHVFCGARELPQTGPSLARANAEWCSARSARLRRAR